MGKLDSIIGATTYWLLKNVNKTWFTLVWLTIAILIGSTGFMPLVGMVIVVAFFFGHFSAYSDLEDKKVKEKKNDKA